MTELNLKKLFVLVSKDLNVTVENVKTTSSNAANADKIYFVEKYNLIVKNGIAYGIDPKTTKEISTLLTSLGATIAEDGTVSFSISDFNYKGEATTILGIIANLDTKIKSEMNKLAASKTLYTDYEFAGKMQFVQATTGENATEAHIALFEKDGTTEIAGTAVTVSQLIGSGIVNNSAYDSTTGILTINFVGGYSVNVDLKALFDIDDVVIADNSQKYLKTEITTTENGEKGIKLATKIVNIADATANTAEADQPSNEVTGLVDALDAKTYIDNKVASVDAEGDDYVSAKYNSETSKITVSTDVKVVTGTKGTVGAYDGEGVETTAPVHGTLTGVGNALADSAQSMSKVKDYVDGEVAIEAARADAKVLASIKALDSSVSSDSTNVNVSITEVDGKLTGLAVSEDYATISKTDSTSTATEPKSDATFTVTSGDEGKLVKASDLNTLAAHAANLVLQEANARTKAINDLDVTDATVAETGEGAINFKYSETDGIVSISGLSVTYAQKSGNGNTAKLNSGIVDTSVLNAALSDLWETFTVDNTITA